MATSCGGLYTGGSFPCFGAGHPTKMPCASLRHPHVAAHRPGSERVGRGSEPLLRRAAGAAVALEIRVAPWPVTVVADRGCVEHVVVTLVRSARDAMPHGGTVTIAAGRTGVATRLDSSAAPVLPPDAYATLTVTVSAAGIDKAGPGRIVDAPAAPGSGEFMGTDLLGRRTAY